MQDTNIIDCANESTSLVVFGEKINRELVFQPGGSKDLLDAIKTRARSFVPDATTPKGRAEIASMANQIARTKTALDGAGKELKDVLQKQITPIDGERKRIRDELDALKEEVRSPLTEYENMEKARVQGHEDAIAAIAILKELRGDETSEQISKLIDAARIIFSDRGWSEFTAKAKETFDTVYASLTIAFDRTKKQEEEQAELARMRKEQEERERKEREDRIAAEAAAKAKREAEEQARRELEAAEARAKKAEEDRIAAAKKAESDRIEAAEKAKRDAEAAAKAERDRIAAEMKAEADAEAKREADKDHRAKINNEALDAMVSSIQADAMAEHDKRLISKDILTAIAKGKVPHVKIVY